MADETKTPLPPRFAELKQQIASTYPNFEEKVTRAWNEILAELEQVTKNIARAGPDSVPQVSFADLSTLSQEEIAAIKRKGCIIIRDVVDDAQASGWKTELEKYVTANNAPGFPEENKQFYQVYWSKPQVQARSHPNVLQVSSWLNGLYHYKSSDAESKNAGVDLATPLSYADRFRIRHPSPEDWGRFPPHVDCGAIERWEDPNFRSCFEDILRGDWRSHDPYKLEGRLSARTSMYGRPNQANVFRTFQGWLSMSNTGPTEGTLKVFPYVGLSNAYLILRPFFRPVASPSSPGLLAASDWEYDTSSPAFPGIFPQGDGYAGPRPTVAEHPHLKLDTTMVSVPRVKPGDMVFWHCDVIHSVEGTHTGPEDSAVMYIGAVPYTPKNAAYIERQKATFLAAQSPPDYPPSTESGFIDVGTPEDISGLRSLGGKAMGFAAQIPVA
ncbi:hypothetical protein PLICRDRAFT_43911 [Plicaturopsis crispa FD-325 SS-3]|nr:hypothetical protein PLICRDRAFT_43911 [Plicaturopsis crispa FD-325 SS-3]